MNVPNQNNPQQNNQDQENHNLALKINTQLNTFDLNNPKGLVKQSLKNCLGLNFNNFNNTYTRNILNFGPEKIYFLTHNLRTNFEKDKKVPSPFDDLISKYNAAKFEQISNNFLSREKDYYKEFVEINGNIGINNLNNIHNITSELRKINANNPFNYMQENPDFDFNNNKMGLYLLLQQNGNAGKIFDPKKNKISTSYKRCNEHQRRRDLKKKEKNLEKKSLIIANNKILSSDYKKSYSRLLSSKKSLNIKDNIIEKGSNSISISSLNQKNSYLNEEETNLFDKYFNSFIPFFKELINNKKININDKILKIREVLDKTIDIFREGRKNFCEFMKRLITPLNNNDNSYKLTTKSLISRVIKYLENDFERKNYISPQGQVFQKKDDYLSNYTNNIIYTYFSDVTSNSKSQTILLWAKIYFYIRFGWKRECIEYINQIEGININESGLREMKESLDDSKKITIQNYNEFKRILNQENKKENPFKHACMVYMTKMPEQLYDNILLEINDHLWFNLNLIYPQDNYEHLIAKKGDDDNKEDEFEINTNSNKNNDGKMLELIKLKDLQIFFDNINTQKLIYSNNKNTNFVYVILLIGLLKFKTALSFMIKNNMYEDAINFYLILKQIGIYSDFDNIDENIIDNNKIIINLDKTKQRQEIYQIYPRVSDNIPALMLYLIFSANNFIQPLSYLILETESFGVLNNYYKNALLFQNNNNINNPMISTFNFCLRDIIDEATLIKICKTIFQLLLKYEMKNNANLTPLFNTFKDLKMLTELTGLLINKSLELINLKKPMISLVNGQLSIYLIDNNNQKFMGYNLIMNNFGSLINDVNKIFIEKQNELQLLVNANVNNNENERIFLLQREIDENNIPISLLKQLPIIENIYECIFTRNFDEAFSLYMDNISIVRVGFDNNEKDYLNEFNFFVKEILKKMKYGLIALYPDILYLFVFLLKIELIEFQQKGFYKIISSFKDKSKALEFLLDRLCELSKNDKDLMKYLPKFIMAKNEVNQIQQFYHQNSYIL